MPCAHYHPFHPHQLAETKVKRKKGKHRETDLHQGWVAIEIV